MNSPDGCYRWAIGGILGPAVAFATIAHVLIVWMRPPTNSC